MVPVFYKFKRRVRLHIHHERTVRVINQEFRSLIRARAFVHRTL